MKRLLLLALVCLCAVSAHSQSSFTVPVTNTAGNAIVGATVTYTCLSGGCGSNSYVAITDKNGNAQFSNVAAGRYTVTTAGPGISSSSYTQDVPLAGNGAAICASINVICVDGVTNATLAQAVTKCGAAQSAVFITIPTTVTANLTVPNNCDVTEYQGGLLTIATGVTLTFNTQFHAGRYPTFLYQGTGKVVLGVSLTDGVKPEWFGAKGDGITDDHVAIQNAFNAAIIGVSLHDATRAHLGSPISLACADYNIGSPGLNFTNTDDIRIDACNQFSGRLIANFTGVNTVGFDFSGSGWGTFTNVAFICGTSIANAPTVCVLRARTNTGNTSNAIINLYQNVSMQGFSPWIYYNYRAEQDDFRASEIYENATTGTPYTISAVNTAGITSPNGVTFGGANSCTLYKLSGTGMVVGSAATAAGSKIVYLDEGSSTSVIQSIWLDTFVNQNGSNETFIGDTSGATGQIDDVVTLFHTNSQSNTNTITNMTGKANFWDIEGQNDPPNNAGSTALTFGNISSSFVRVNTGVTSCFTASNASLSTIILDGCTPTAPNAAYIISSNAKLNSLNSISFSHAGSTTITSQSLGGGFTATVPATTGSLLENGPAPTPTGTGACATFSTQTGGTIGTFKCTGTSGAATITLTFGYTASNGWSCDAADQTTTADTLQPTVAGSPTTTCTFSSAAIANGDQIRFRALPF